MRFIRKLPADEIQVFQDNLKCCPPNKKLLSAILQENPENINGVGDTLVSFRGEKVIQYGLYCMSVKNKTMYYVVILPMGDMAFCYSVY